MDTVKVENIGINAVDSEICKYDVLIGHLKDNDKSISKDGYIELYSKNQLTSKNLLGEIPVQVKGKSVMNFSPKYILEYYHK